jgi:2-polyprenyl-3-methyl-5-hydroxy-6-metoxy-1,4-benzoquinol methylase
MLTRTGAFEAIAPLKEKYRVQCSLEEFHSAVNLAFHKHESAVYDQVHKVMWDSLPEQFLLLVGDVERSGPLAGGALALLDIGCGTGLASDSMVRTALGPRIASLTLLDVSPEMLARAKTRSANWKKQVEPMLGMLHEVPLAKKYDIIITSSVLHHIPDLADFLANVARLQAPRGVFLHMQDPNGDYMHDPTLVERKAEYKLESESQLPGWLRRLAPSRLAARMQRLLGATEPVDYLSLTNQELLTSGVIAKPMSPPDIWAITDLHDNEDTGVSIEQMKPLLPGYDLISSRSYAFCGQLAGGLTGSRLQQESELIAQQAPNGQYVGAVWRHRS